MGATSPLRKWEQIVKKQLGLSRMISHILLVSVVISFLVLSYFGIKNIYHKQPETAPIEVDVIPEMAHDKESESESEKLHNQSTTTMIEMTIGPDGLMHSETTTETMGTDANGQVHATRETSTGGNADKEAEEMMNAVNQMMGGFMGGFGNPFGGGGGGLLGQLFGAPQPDPILELLGLGDFGQMHRHAPAHEVFELRNHHHKHNQRPRHHDSAGIQIMGLNDLISALVEPVVEVIEMPAMVIDLSGGNGHGHHHNHNHNHANASHGTPELQVIAEPSK
jgi:ABC-type nickel/cobalt efflux system permease component RcnA